MKPKRLRRTSSRYLLKPIKPSKYRVNSDGVAKQSALANTGTDTAAINIASFFPSLFGMTLEKK